MAGTYGWVPLFQFLLLNLYIIIRQYICVYVQMFNGYVDMCIKYLYLFIQIYNTNVKKKYEDIDRINVHLK